MATRMSLRELEVSLPESNARRFGSDEAGYAKTRLFKSSLIERQTHQALQDILGSRAREALA